MQRRPQETNGSSHWEEEPRCNHGRTGPALGSTATMLQAPVVTTAKLEVGVPEAAGRYAADQVAVGRHMDNRQQEVVRCRRRQRGRVVVVHTETGVAVWERPGRMMIVELRLGVSMQLG